MYTIVLRLDPTQLENPDSDIRYVLPDLIVESSEGLMTSDGYDYIGEPPLLLLYLQTTQLELAVKCVIDRIGHLESLAMTCETRQSLRSSTQIAMTWYILAALANLA